MTIRMTIIEQEVDQQYVVDVWEHSDMDTHLEVHSSLLDKLEPNQKIIVEKVIE